MGFFAKLKKQIILISAIFCFIPLLIAGGFMIYYYFVYDKPDMLFMGIFILFLSIFSSAFICKKAIGYLNPLEKATAKLFDALSEDEKKVLSLSAGNTPTHFVYALIDYTAGKQIVSGSNAQQRKLFEAAADCTEEIIWRRDEHGDFYYIPEIWRSRYGDINLKNGVMLEEYIHPDNIEEFSNEMKILTAESGRKFAMNILLNAGERCISVGITIRSSEVGGKVCCVGVMSDSEKILEFEDTIKEKYLMYHFALRAISDILYEVDVPENKYIILNPERWSAIFDIPLNGNFSFHRSSYYELIHPDNQKGFKDRFGNYDHLLFMPDRSITYDYRIRHKNSDWIWVRHSVTSVKDENGHVLKVIGHISDINEKKRQEFRDMYDHRHDSLTGAFLRSTLEADFLELVNVQKRPAIVMSVDIDNFKDVVDYYGYRAGDLVLRAFVHTLWECQVGRCSVGRVGNDDFIIVMKEYCEEMTPVMMAERIISALSEPYKIDNRRIVITTSIGWSEYGKDGTSFDRLITKAEAARFIARTKGKNRYAAYEEEAAE